MSLANSSSIRKLIDGDEIALRALYDLYGEQLYQLAFRILKDTAWSEEIVQDVYLKLWQNREALDAEGDIWVYLYVIAKRLCLNKLREIRKSPILFEQLLNHIEIASSSSEEILLANELERQAQDVIARLPQQQQLVFKLSREEGLSHIEIAQRLGISPNTVKNHMVQALKTLKANLQQSGYTYFLALLFVNQIVI